MSVIRTPFKAVIASADVSTASKLTIYEKVTGVTIGTIHSNERMVVTQIFLSAKQATNQLIKLYFSADGSQASGDVKTIVYAVCDTVPLNFYHVLNPAEAGQLGQYLYVKGVAAGTVSIVVHGYIES